MRRRLDREAVEKSVKLVPNKEVTSRVRQLNLFELLQQYPYYIIENSVVSEICDGHNFMLTLEQMKTDTRNVLVCNVKRDNLERFLDQTAKLYYTGNRFPSTVALNNLYYFMPYIKSKGIRDLYLIRTARVGTRKEGQPDNNPNDLRIVFEIEFVKQLFDDYKPIRLKIWRTYTDTTLSQLISTIG